MNIRKNNIVLALAIITTVSASAKVVTYPAPEEAPRNDAFSVEVRQDAGKWQPVDVYAIKVDKTEGCKHNVVLTSVATFDFDGTAEVRVVSNRQGVKSCDVRPQSYAIAPAVSGDTITFTLDRPRQVSVEVNGDRFNNLQLFANPLDANAPANLKKWSRKKENIYIGPGYHKLDTIMVVGSGKTVYIAGGAYVDGYI
ncbi:MAG: endo-polygalacturonase, partial [Muribaculaceae bacterium]|nr:endo-polygalacturonase [Muribaculaceae bacterium]